ncbi:unnamed protein product [Gongylonema pulchrum]|uniref:G_PROTEIN_RECEP_F1_2 domain-containing protein n=1 Tax=Gongylonema pulchrum TaxID=637853 RepID=A0A183EQ41_9BILA|nr:unnamed protein product [Gongylonema pulchrum]
MCISCSLTAVLHIALFCSRFINSGYEWHIAEFVIAYVTISSNLNPLVIIVAACVLQDDIREAVFALFPQRLQLLLTKWMPNVWALVFRRLAQVSI